MQRLGTDVDDTDCPFCGCPVLLPPPDDASSWSCASCGALGRRRTPTDAPLIGRVAAR